MNGFLEIEALSENFRQCKVYTRHFAKTFYFSSHVLPKDKRYASYAVYAFCRYADEIADVATVMADPLYAKNYLDNLRNQLRYVYSGSPLMDKKLLAFRETVLQYRIPREHFDDLLRGVEMDLTATRFATFAELDQYCYRVASVVGLIMTRILGSSSNEAYSYARDLGTAMQLTNILRDVGEDLHRGRIYLPLDELRSFGYSEEDLSAHRVNEAFRNLMRFHIRRARQYYERAELGISMLRGKGSRLCVRLMSRTYSRILDAIEKNDYDVFSKRAYVPLAKKMRLMFGAVLGRNARTSNNQEQQNPTVTLITAGQL